LEATQPDVKQYKQEEPPLCRPLYIFCRCTSRYGFQLTSYNVLRGAEAISYWLQRGQLCDDSWSEGGNMEVCST
jgi:hypothetical protein